MTREEILAYNKKCAEFLGGVYQNDMTKYWFRLPEHLHNSQDYLPFAPTTSQLQFHSDWNWIMEVRNKILSINSYSNKGQRFTFNLNATAKYIKNENDKPYKVRVKGVRMSEPRPFIEVNSFDEKEAVVAAINEFLNWYNENK